MQSYENGITKVIGRNNWKNHKRKYQDSYVSITMYWTGSIDGITGPSIFLLEGNNHQGTYSDNFL